MQLLQAHLQRFIVKFGMKVTRRRRTTKCDAHVLIPTLGRHRSSLEGYHCFNPISDANIVLLYLSYTRVLTMLITVENSGTLQWTDGRIRIRIGTGWFPQRVFILNTTTNCAESRHNASM